MLADPNSDSHPLRQQHLRAVVKSFDVITYGKGAALLRMLASHVGISTFLRGIQRYVLRYQYGCMTEADLWGAINDEVSAIREADGLLRAHGVQEDPLSTSNYAEVDEGNDGKRQWRLKSREQDLSSHKGTPFELAENTPTRRTDRVRVHDLIRPWTRRVGFPALHVRADY